MARFCLVTDQITKPIYWFALGCLSIPLQVKADISSSTKVDDLEEVVVTATRGQTLLPQETRTISVLDRQQITAQQASSVAQLLQSLPNIEITGGPRANAQSPVIRGLDGSRVLQVIDGVRHNAQSGHRNSYMLDPELLQSIEVIKGPSGSLWGSGALGGVVAQRTISASDFLVEKDIGGYLKQHYAGADNQSKTSGSVYGVLGNSVDALLNGYYIDSDNLRLGNSQKLQDSAHRNQGGMVKIGWQPEDIQRLEFIVRQADIHQNVPSNPSQNISRSVPLINQKTRDRNITLDYQITPVETDLVDARITAYMNQTRFNELRLNKQQNDYTDYRTLGLNLGNHSHIDSVGLDYGIDYYRDRSTGLREGKNRPMPPDGRSQVIGSYLQGDLPLTSHWSLQPGVRYDYYKNQDQNIIDSKRSEQRFSPSVGLRWQATNWLVLSSRYDEAFRAPSMEELYTQGTHFCMGPMGCNKFLPNPNLKPETAKNRSVSAQMSFNHVVMDDDSVVVDVTYFQNRLNNFINQDVKFKTTQYINVNDARLQGGELAARYDWKGLQASISYAQTQGKDQATGEALQNIPANKWRADIGYQFFQNSLKSGIIVNRYQTQSKIPSTSTERYPGYTIVDLYTTWHPQQSRLKNIHIDFAIDNLTDRYYRQAFNQLYSAGRNVKVAVRYQF